MAVSQSGRGARFSLVLEFPPPDPRVAVEHFQDKLRFETDPADVFADMGKREPRFAVIDARSPEAYREGHVPGAINLPHRRIDAEAVRDLPRDRTLVTYCWGPGCNASTRAAARLAALGFRVKEMIGGIEYWEREGHSLEAGA